jgi:hypothetical protein
MMQVLAGLSEREVERVRGRLVEFCGEVFASMARKDQCRWGQCNVRGLILDGKRKSIEPIAARLPDGDEPCVPQSVNQSPWDEARSGGVGQADGPRALAGGVSDR